MIGLNYLTRKHGVMTNHPLLTLNLLGTASKISARETSTLIDNVQLCVTRVGEVLALGESKVKQGGLTKREIAIADACKLSVQPFTAGGEYIGFDLFNAHIQQEIFAPTLDEPLGMVAVRQVVEGIGSLERENYHLIESFDFGVVEAIRDISNAIRGKDGRITFHYQNGKDVLASMGIRVRERAINLLTEVEIFPVTARGILDRVSLANKSCQISDESTSVACTFPDSLRSTIKDAIGDVVEAFGEATRIAPGLPNAKIKEVKLQQIRVIERGRGTAKSRKPLTAQALIDLGFFKLGEGRSEEIDDSIEFARQLREQTWGGRS